MGDKNGIFQIFFALGTPKLVPYVVNGTTGNWGEDKKVHWGFTIDRRPPFSTTLWFNRATFHSKPLIFISHTPEETEKCEAPSCMLYYTALSYANEP